MSLKLYSNNKAKKISWLTVLKAFERSGNIPEERLKYFHTDEYTLY